MAGESSRFINHDIINVNLCIPQQVPEHSQYAVLQQHQKSQTSAGIHENVRLASNAFTWSTDGMCPCFSHLLPVFSLNRGQGGSLKSCDSLLKRVEGNDSKLVELVILPMKTFGGAELDRLSNAIGKALDLNSIFA